MKLSFVVFLSWLARATALQPKYLITTPNIIHLGVEETVTIQLQGATTPGEAELKVKTSRSMMTNIQLTAESPDIFPKNEITKKHAIKEIITLSTRKGYIFIQTDKPIYNPGEYVKYRIFTLDHYLLPTEENIQVHIFNSKGLKIFSNAMHSNKIYQKSMLIPDVEFPGHWRIEAAYLNHPMSNSSVEFEVKEYVLPVFEVKIEPFKKYVILKDESFQFSISARYTYGKGVNGVAYVRFALVSQSGNRTYLSGMENNTRMQDGIANIALATRDLLAKAADEQIEHFDDFHLYIAVTALETASGDLEEAETSVKIVTSPYRIDMSKTKEYFTPGGIFSILASTTFPDGSLAPDLRMRAVVKSARAARPVDQSALSVEIKHATLAPGQEMRVTLRDIVPTGTPRPSHIHYLILSKGRVVRMNRVHRTELTTVNLPFGADLVPSFRIVAYYHTEPHGMVADSVWADVKDVCEGQVEIQPFNEHKPADLVNVEVRSSHAGKVALAAVDTAVYILNKQNKLTPQKMFDYMNSYDLACTMGGGTDFESVLQDAGLALLTSVAISKKQIRKVEKNSKNNLENACCYHGAKLNHMRLSCDQRYAKTTHMSAECRRVFLKCCKDATKLREDIKKRQRTQSLARTDVVEGEEAINDIVVHLRSYFPQTWMWDVIDVGPSGRVSHQVSVPDSITTWEIQAVWNFSQTGFCIAEPKPLTVFQDFFVSLKLPYSVKRNEQLEVKAVVYNYQAEGLEVKVGMHPAEGLCTAGAEGGAQVVWVPGNSAVPVYFTAVPLTIGHIPIHVDANSKTRRDSIKKELNVVGEGELVSLEQEYNIDAKSDRSFTVEIPTPPNLVPDQQSLAYVSIKGETPTLKELDSDSEFAQVNTIRIDTIVLFEFNTIRIDTIELFEFDTIRIDTIVLFEFNTIRIDTIVLFEFNTIRIDTIVLFEFNTIKIDTIVLFEFNTIRKNVVLCGVMGESVENCLDLQGVDKLIAMPRGCAEQTMVTMSPAIHALRYLDATNQWVDLRAERRDEALAMIQSGYSRIITFKKTDGSYGAFKTRPSSVWLTAYIAKELSNIKDVITVDESYIQESISYLLTKQLESGVFNDPNPLYDRTMQGGVGGFEADVSLAAFVMLAMHHAYPLYSEFSEDRSKLLRAMRMSGNYIDSKMDSLQRPFAVAIAAYALSLTSPGSASAARAQTKLRSMAICDESEDTCQWEASEDLRLRDESRASAVPKADAISVETTAYALLQAVAEQDMQYAARIARWLTQQRKYGGGFRSTQDTVVALEALTTFGIQDDDAANLNLNVEICDNGGRKQTVQITKKNALNSPAFQMLQTYRSLEKTEQYCDLFHLSVSVEGEVAYTKMETYGDDLDDYDNYDTDQEPSEEPVSRVELFDLRTRRKRQAPQQEQKENWLFYKVCVGLKSGTSNGMVIVDISLLSGLQPNIQDLEENVKGTERYIDHYDLGPNKVFLYFAEITAETECVMFRAKQISPIGLVQPAAAVVYAYYNPERKCGVFYSAPQKSSMISKLCQDSVCTCAEDRKDNVQPGGVRDLIKRKACSEFNLKTDGEYLIMGRSRTISKTVDHKGKPIYVLDNEVWMEEIPEDRRCKASKNRSSCKLLQDFMQQHELNNCSF
ncbi:LOW QUALITY PROTEIN: complement C4-A [Aplochiton taeniatus]